MEKTWSARERHYHPLWETTVGTEDGRNEEEITKTFKEERLT